MGIYRCVGVKGKGRRKERDFIKLRKDFFFFVTSIGREVKKICNLIRSSTPLHRGFPSVLDAFSPAPLAFSFFTFHFIQRSCPARENATRTKSTVEKTGCELSSFSNVPILTFLDFSSHAILLNSIPFRFSFCSFTYGRTYITIEYNLLFLHEIE